MGYVTRSFYAKYCLARDTMVMPMRPSLYGSGTATKSGEFEAA
jgi:hypothetical protein